MKKEVVVRYDKTENNYAAIVEGLDGFLCTADTFSELQDEVKTGVEFHLEGLRETGLPVPEVFESEYTFTYKLFESIEEPEGNSDINLSDMEDEELYAYLVKHHPEGTEEITKEEKEAFEKWLGNARANNY